MQTPGPGVHRQDAEPGRRDGPGRPQADVALVLGELRRVHRRPGAAPGHQRGDPGRPLDHPAIRHGPGVGRAHRHRRRGRRDETSASRVHGRRRLRLLHRPGHHPRRRRRQTRGKPRRRPQRNIRAGRRPPRLRAWVRPAGRGPRFQQVFRRGPPAAVGARTGQPTDGVHQLHNPVASGPLWMAGRPSVDARPGPGRSHHHRVGERAAAASPVQPEVHQLLRSIRPLAEGPAARRQGEDEAAGRPRREIAASAGDGGVRRSFLPAEPLDLGPHRPLSGGHGELQAIRREEPGRNRGCPGQRPHGRHAGHLPRGESGDPVHPAYETG